MRLKDIEPGEIYAVVQYFDKWVHTAVEDEGRLEEREWETAYSTLFAGRVVEKGVSVQHYSRPGVRVQRLDRQTLEPLVRDGAVVEPEGYLATNVLLPWSVWDRRWHEHVDAKREQERERRERFEREKARRQEAQARSWMVSEFDAAQRALEDVCAVLQGDEEALADVSNFANGDVTDELRDRLVRAIVERRHSDGNPYLNGERQVN